MLLCFCFFKSLKSWLKLKFQEYFEETKTQEILLEQMEIHEALEAYKNNTEMVY